MGHGRIFDTRDGCLSSLSLFLAAFSFHIFSFLESGGGRLAVSILCSAGDREGWEVIGTFAGVGLRLIPPSLCCALCASCSGWW